MCTSVLPAYVFVPHASNVLGVQKASELLDLALWTVVSHCVDAGTEPGFSGKAAGAFNLGHFSSSYSQLFLTL